MASDLTIRKGQLMEFASSRGPALIPVFGAYANSLLSFEKPDVKKAGRFCLACFLKEVNIVGAGQNAICLPPPFLTVISLDET